MRKVLLSAIFTVSLFSGICLADCVDIEVDNGNSYSFCITKWKDNNSKYSVKVANAKDLTMCSVGRKNYGSSWDFYDCEGNISNWGTSGIYDLSLTISYDKKHYTKRAFYDLTNGIFANEDGDTLPSNIEDYNTENDNIENNNTENNSNKDNNTNENSTENLNTANNNIEDNNTQDNNESDNNENNNIQNSSNNDNTENVKKNTILNLTTNDKSPKVKQYINLTIETDEYFTGKLSFSIKYKNDSANSWSMITNTNSTYYSAYSDEWENGYYKMKTSDYGEITLKNFVSFKKSGIYKIYVDDGDGNEKYIQFTVSEEDNNTNTDSIKESNKNDSDKNINSENRIKYDDVIEYNNSIVYIIDNCIISTQNTRNDFLNGYAEGFKDSVNTTIDVCKNVQNELNNDNGREGDVTLKNASLSLIGMIIKYYEKFSELIPIVGKEWNDLTDKEKDLNNSVVSEMDSINENLEKIGDLFYEIQDKFANKWGFWLPNICSVEGSKYSYEQTVAYQRACELGITTIRDINSAGLEQPLTRAQLAKMMSVFAFMVLQKEPQQKEIVKYKDVSNSMGDLADYIQIAYQYGIMGVNSNGSAIEYFNPNGTLNRGDFATVFSRVLRGNKYNNNGKDYYSKHLNALKNAGYLTNTDHNLSEIRGYVILMMYRATNNLQETNISYDNSYYNTDKPVLTESWPMGSDAPTTPTNKATPVSNEGVLTKSWPGTNTNISNNSNNSYNNSNYNTSTSSSSNKSNGSTKSTGEKSNSNSINNTTSYTDLDRYIDTARTRSKYGLDTTITVNKGTPGSSNGVVNINSTCAKFGGTNCEIKGGKYYGVTAEITSNGTIKIDTSRSKYGSTSALTSNKGTLGAPKGTLGAPKGKL